MYKHTFAGCLSKELKNANIWYKMIREKEGSQEYLIYIFRQGGSIKIPNDPGSDYPDRWEWHGEAGRAIDAISTFMRDLGDDKLPPRMMRGATNKRSPWYKVMGPDPSVLPIEYAIDKLLTRARAKPVKTRAVNEDGSLRCIVYTFAKGAVIEVFECRKWRLCGPIDGVYWAVRAADRAYHRHWETAHRRRPKRGDRAHQASAD